MLRRLTTSEKIALAIDAYAAAIRDAFIRAIAEIRSSITLALVVKRIEANDIAGVVRALNIETPAFNPMLDEIATAYTGGGNATIDDLPVLNDAEGYRINLRFDARDPVAENWLRDHSATLVREITADQVTAIRNALTAGQVKGLGARQVAREIVSRIGLTDSQSQWVRAYQAELKAGDAKALNRNLRDRRFDKTVAKAIADNKPIPAETIKKMVTAYETRALRFRAEAIGRTESATAMGASSDEAMRQAITSGKVDMGLVDATWRTTMDGRERDSHAAMDGQVQPFGRPFTSGAGFPLRYPGDPFAPASERVNCRCVRTFAVRKQPRPTLQ